MDNKTYLQLSQWKSQAIRNKVAADGFILQDVCDYKEDIENRIQNYVNNFQGQV